MDNKEKSFISAVVYLHNPKYDTVGFSKMLIETLQTNFENSEIIVVNDMADPADIEAIRKMCKDCVNCSVTILNLSYFHGLEAAMMAGIDLAIGDFVFEFDSSSADYDPELIMQVYQKALEGYDTVSASPNKKPYFSSKMFYHTFERFSETKIQMCSERFRIVSRRLLNRITSANKTIPYRKVLYTTSGFKGCSITYEPVSSKKLYRNREENKLRRKTAIDSLLLFTQFGYKFAISMAVIMMLTSIAMIIYSVVIYIAAKPVEGWTTTILFLSFAFFGLFSVLTIVIRYLQILIELVFKRKHYNFESIEKL